jgi:hypothetical protein
MNIIILSATIIIDERYVEYALLTSFRRTRLDRHFYPATIHADLKSAFVMHKLLSPHHHVDTYMQV